MFSRRLPDDLAPNAIARARQRLGPPRFDLTVSNPTHCGLTYPESLTAALADPRGLSYDPDPHGLPSARRAVAAELARHGAVIDAAAITLTASTSEAYAHLFRLLCNPGEVVLTPAPSYPLFEHLARAEGVTARPYSLDSEDGWRLDLSSLRAAPRSTRAVIVVHPNNPTGSFVDDGDALALAALCAERGWALIADEVFLDYPLDGIRRRSFSATHNALVFTLGGLSKSVGLPQLKLAWIATSGPPDLVRAASERLEMIADTFLSVSTPVQLAAPHLLSEGVVVRDAITARLHTNLQTLSAATAAVPSTSLVVPSGGWSAVLRYPDVMAEEDLVIDLLETDGVLVQPGFFFDFPRDGYLVLSLLPPSELFGGGVGRLLARISSLS